MFIRGIGQGADYIEVMEVSGKDKTAPREITRKKKPRMKFSKTSKIHLGLCVVHTHNPNTLEAEAGGWLQSRPDLNSKFQTSQGYIKRL